MGVRKQEKKNPGVKTFYADEKLVSMLESLSMRTGLSGSNIVVRILTREMPAYIDNPGKFFED